MLIYKTVNVCGGGLTDRFIEASKINAEVLDGWKLVNITVPPEAINNKCVIGVFVKDVPTEEKKVDA